MKLHIVSSIVDGYAKEDAKSAFVIGAYTKLEVANAVCKVSGYGARVSAIDVDHTPPGLLSMMKHYGIKLPEESLSC